MAKKIIRVKKKRRVVRVRKKQSRYVVMEVGTEKRNYKKPKIIRVVKSRSAAQKLRTAHYKRYPNVRVWIVSKRGTLGSESY